MRAGSLKWAPKDASRGSLVSSHALSSHRQNGFALEPRAQSGFGHYQAQEVRTLAWLKS